jgi:hypothetical protein
MFKGIPAALGVLCPFSIYIATHNESKTSQIHTKAPSIPFPARSPASASSWNSQQRFFSRTPLRNADPGPSQQPRRPRLASREEVYKARNRSLLMYTTAVVRLFPSSPLFSLPRSNSAHDIDHWWYWRHLCRRPALSRLLRRDRVRGYARRRHGPVRGRPARPRRGRAADQGPLQRGRVRAVAVVVRAPAEVRHGPPWRNQSGVLSSEE